VERRKQRIKDFRFFSRELADSAFRVYFGKPPFNAYGYMNTKQPKTLYGEYMLSHNVNPMRMGNNPEYV